MTILGLKKGGGLNSLPHGVAHIRISTKAISSDVDEFYGVFYCGDYIDGKFSAHHEAQDCFDELCRQEQQL